MPKERLTAYFRENGVGYESLTFREVYTAQEVAAALHLPGWHLAKVVIVKADDRLVMLALPAPARVDFAALKNVLGVKEARLAKEAEFKDLFPDCEIGGMPPFGNLYDVPVYVDRSLTEAGEIAFLAGSHHEAMKIAYADFERLAQPTVAEFTV